MDAGHAKPSWLLRGSTLVAYVVLIVVNVLAGTGYLGRDNAKISKHFDTPITPAGWAFSIWGLIFLLQGLGTLYSCLPHGYNTDGGKQRVVNAKGYSWQLGWYCECAWQAFFAREDVIGMWFCAFFLLGGLACFGRALHSLYRMAKDSHGPASSVLLYVVYLLPTSVNTAWLSVASCLGILIVPRAYHVAVESLVIPGIFLAALTTCAGAWIVHKSRDTAYALTLVWALLAIFGNCKDLAVRVSSLLCVIVMGAAAIASVLRRKRSYGPVSDVREPLRQMA